MKKKQEKWMGEAMGRKPGALHRQLHISKDETIPTSLLKRIVESPVGYSIANPTKTGHHVYTVTPLMKRRATPALTARGFKRRKRKRGKIIY